MTLLEILVSELPKRGGWPDGVAAMAQDDDGSVQNYSDTYDIRIDSYHAYGMSRIVGSYSLEEGEVSAGTDRLTAIITREQYESALASVEPEWNGEGLPPVGCECEYLDGNNEWYPVTIKYASNQIVVICGMTNIFGEEQETEIAKDIQLDKPQFRPIRSEADMKRDELAKALHIAVGAAPVELGGIGPVYLELADKIIAGEIPHLKIV
ncbi:TPA: hypothetical protein RUY31_004144 [Klebsiella quasipneumoniae subsp. similipneumoniae]|nr:hypothetical protein [Klebsiella quasipneumoniae subsp. similipneumoniae]